MQIVERTLAADSKTEIGSVWARPEGWQRGPRAAVVLAHGAGAGMDHEFISHLHLKLAHEGYLTVKFNFPYKHAGRKAPDRAQRLEAAFCKLLEAVRAYSPGPKHLFVGGKSMGGRIASQLAAQGEKMTGLFLLGYPLHPPHRPQRLRSEHLAAIGCPALFIQGTRDALCRLDLLGPILSRLTNPVRLQVIEGGDHSFNVLKRSGRTRAEARQEVLATLLNWLAQYSV